MSGTTARRRARRGSAPRRSNTQQLSQLTVLLNTIRNSRGQQQQAPRASAAAAQTLVCNFSSVAAPREIRYTAVGGTVGTWVNTATVTYDAADSPKSAQASVTVTLAAPQETGSCCSSDFTCSSNADRDSCTAAGGEWRSDPNACSSKMFCAGACCSAGGTAAAACSITKKADCVGSGGGSGQWVADGDCNDPSFCPKPTQCMNVCQECTATLPCCGGLSCMSAGNGWSASRYICCQTPYYRTYRMYGYRAYGYRTQAAAATSESAAAAAGSDKAAAAAVGVDATPSNAVNTFCSAIGGLCGRHEEGRQCCGPKADCIVGDGLVARCKPRDSCKTAGSTCSSIGQCCSGLVCKGKACVRAECKVPSSCQPRDYLCKHWHELNCEAYYAAATSSTV